MIEWNIPALLNRGWKVYERHTNNQSQILMLCPWYDFDNVPDGTIFWHVRGQRTVKGQDHFCKDTIAGLLGYGVWVTR